jgi:hypothetical protein
MEKRVSTDEDAVVAADSRERVAQKQYEHDQ